MANPGSHKYLLVAATFALTLVNVDLLSAKAQTRLRTPPCKGARGRFHLSDRSHRNKSEGAYCRGLDLRCREKTGSSK